MSYEPIRTCILGTGLAGLTFHAPFVLALPQLFTLHSIFERNPKSEGGRLQDRFGVSVKIHRSFESVLADSEVELVIVGTPNETHYPFVKASLEAGKHVLVDKPITENSAHAKELGRLAKSKNLVLYGFQNRRWDSDFQALQRLLALPKSSPTSLGDIFEFESRFDRYRTDMKGTWKDVTGNTYDLGPHVIDQALVLFGRPSKVTAFTANVRNVGKPDIDDSFTIMLHYAPGAGRPHPLTVILRAHVLSVRSKQLRYVVRGTKGTFEKFGVDVQEDQLKAMADPSSIYDRGYGKEPESIWGTVENFREDGQIVKTVWPQGDTETYVGLFSNLGKAIREGAPLTVKWNEATAVVEMIELAYRSSKEGRTVDVPETLGN